MLSAARAALSKVPMLHSARESSTLEEPLRPQAKLRRRASQAFEEASLSASTKSNYWFATKQRRMVMDFRDAVTCGTKVLNGPRGPLLNTLLELLYQSTLSFMLGLTIVVFFAVAAIFALYWWATSCTIEDEDSMLHLLVYGFASLSGMDIQDGIARELRCTFGITMCQFVGLLLQGIIFVRALHCS